MKEIQKLSTEIIKKMDGKLKGEHDIDTTLIHLTEELGEISSEIYNDRMGRDKLNKENLKEEFADVIMLLSHLANHFDIDIKRAVKRKIQVLKERYKLK